MLLLLAVYLHVLAAVLLVGYALFWTVVALARPRDGASGDALLDRLARTPWPPEGLPSPVRVALPGLAWGALAFLVLSGFGLVLGSGAPLEEAFGGGLPRANLATKLVLVAALAAALLAASARPRRPAILAVMALVLSVVALSAAIVR